MMAHEAAVAFLRAYVPNDTEFLICIFIVILSGATLAAYKRMDRYESARRYFTRKDRSRLIIGLLTASLVILTAAGALSMRYIIDSCIRKAWGG